VSEAAARYDACYHSARGAWIGEREFALLARRPGETLLAAAEVSR
jgi:hypothetical protein